MSKFKFGDKVFCKGLFGNGIYFKPSYHGSDEPMCYVLFENYGLKVVRLSSIKKVSDWIQCSERMPDNDDDVLVFDGCEVSIDYIDICIESGDEYFVNLGSDSTHWMPLPEMPEVKE